MNGLVASISGTNFIREHQKKNAVRILPFFFVHSQETTHVKNLLPKTDIKQQTLPNVDTIIEKLRKERKEVTTKSRYEIFN